MNATFTEKITKKFGWEGVTAYLQVDRHRVQERLDAWHNSNKDACNAPRLYIPENPVFPNILNETHHVIYIDVGQLDFYNFKGYPDKRVSVNGLEFSVAIPLLADDPKGLPKYSLALSVFYPRNRGDFPKPNIIFPYTPVDVLEMNNTSVVVQNGNEELRLSFERFLDPCMPPPSIVRHELVEFLDKEFQLGVPEPDISFCKTHPYENHYCSTALKILDEVLLASPNICQSPWKSKNGVSSISCMTPLRIEKITDGFLDFLLIGDDPVQVVASESLIGNFSVGLKYPCME
ncbi:hypothetical protein HOLleu_12635 [Holothuria leucospilota]|uniref:Uncharacterized protein n=1 Tax=Holothuria leucospilota TaxID=206669 RepID=A0A9Q1CBM6_HOLLE|nr:hypothetical protein HOLleu_12635 [Holothuria leucospilota]